MNDLTPTQWISKCAELLWTALWEDREEVAADLWRDACLREPPPDEAEARWLLPAADH